MELNQGKCEMLRFNSILQVKFRDGGTVKVVDQAKYLGCYLNAWSDPMREIRRRIAITLATWKRLDPFWLHSDCTYKFKLIVWHAVVRSRLMYGLEGLHLTKAMARTLDVFQLKGY
eukprot:2452473-Prorocentrum_lima.AAC.1